MINQNYAIYLHSYNGTGKMVNGSNAQIAIAGASQGSGGYQDVAVSTSMSASGTGGSVGASLVVGGGDAPSTPNEYSLETPYVRYTPGSTSVSSDLVRSNNASIYDNRILLGKSCMYRNDTNEVITIKEVGIVMYNYAGNSHRYFLMARKVLKTPVTIEPGKTARIAYTIGIPDSDE